MVTDSAATEPQDRGRRQRYSRGAGRRQSLDRDEHGEPGDQQGFGGAGSEDAEPTWWTRRFPAALIATLQQGKLSVMVGGHLETFELAS